MRLARSLRVGAALALLGGSVLGGAGVGAVAAADPTAVADTAVTVVVQDVTPSSPVYSSVISPLRVTLTLTNTSDSTLYAVSINGEREAPIGSAGQLHDLIAKPRQLDPDTTSEIRRVVLERPLAPHTSGTVIFATTTSNLSDGSSGICLCNAGIYPLDFTVQGAGSSDGVPTKVGFGQTFIPSFPDRPQPVQVSWLWPLIDRPHRLMSDTAFVDDDLSGSVRPGGRLDRALAVAERVAKRVRLTLLVDPDLVDELVVMTERYTVPGPDGRPSPGTGGAAAAAWLARLRAVLPTHDVSRTASADPDVEALTARGVPWQAAPFDAAQQQRINGVLGPRSLADIAWPAGEAVGNQGVQALVQAGSTTVVLNDSTLPGGVDVAPRPDALAPIPGISGALAAVTDRAVQSSLGPLLGIAAAAHPRLPQLIAELAMRAVQAPGTPHFVLAVPDRHINTDPVAATRVILDTTTAGWSAPLSIRQAVGRVVPLDHGNLVAPPASPLPRAAIDAAAQASEFEASFRSALSGPAATALFAGLPAAIQRTASSAWRQDRRRGTAFAAALDAKVGGWRDSVQIQRPANGSYTLASTSAPLFVTVVNSLPVPVRVRVSLSTVNGLVGFRADDVGPQEIPAGQKAPLRIPVHVQRAGRFLLAANVLTPDGDQLGDTVTLGINSTALGAIGVIITAVAAAVLILAVLVRLYRRWRFRAGQRVAA